MKQTPTLKQWNELTVDQMAAFWHKIETEFIEDEWFHWMRLEKVKHFILHTTPNIGQMIQFLGDDLSDIQFTDVSVCLYGKMKRNRREMYFKNDELVDTLWLAVKHKLK